jgi:hypothetical protein
LPNHPDFFEARLRLGRILALNNALQNAREQLEIRRQFRNDVELMRARQQARTFAGS